MLSVADRRPCLLLFDLDLFNDVPHGAIVVSATQGNSVIVRGPANEGTNYLQSAWSRVLLN